MENLNQKTFREQMLKRYSGKGIPVEGVFELTGRCNLNCKMCYIHTQPNAYFAKKERSGDWWIKVIDEACEAGMLFALLSGGECLMHPDFRRIYMHLRSKGIYTRINTNGLLLTQDTIDFLKQNHPLDIQMTLYGTDDDAYEKVTGARVFRQAEAAILRLKESGLSFHIAVTPNSFAPGETERIVRYLKDLNVAYQINAALFTPYSDDDTAAISDKEVDINEKIQYLRAEMKEPGPEIPLEQLPPVGGGRTEEIKGLKCSGGKSSFFMTWDGCMQSCNAFYNTRLTLTDPGDFRVTWEETKRRCREYLLPVECEGCAYKKVCLSCPVLRSPKLDGHCDPEVCELTRRLVAAGVKKLPEQAKSK